METKRPLDCLVIGGGPAGLTAAIYLARFRLTVTVVDEGESRAALIPCTRNHAGYPGGIAGADLLSRMRKQALEYGAGLQTGRIGRLERSDGGFLGRTSTEALAARTVLIATGVTNRRPPMSDAVHRQALATGRLRYCPVCDGYEVTDQKVAVIGTGARALKEALFLRAYTRDVSVLPNLGGHEFTDDQRQQLAEAGVAVVERSAEGFALGEDAMEVVAGSERLRFAAIYPALGSDIHSGLAADVGAACSGDGCIKVDSHQRTSVPLLYAAGDVVVGLDQISHAMGEAGVAATTIRNDIAAQHPLLR